MSNKLKNAVLILCVIVIFVFRAMGHGAFDLVFYIGCAVMAAVEGLYLFLNRKELEERDRVNELFYLCGIGVVIICKMFLF